MFRLGAWKFPRQHPAQFSRNTDHNKNEPSFFFIITLLSAISAQLGYSVVEVLLQELSSISSHISIAAMWMLLFRPSKRFFS